MNDGNSSDEWLMGQVAQGSQLHLEQLLRRYASPLLTYVQRMVGDRHRGEEVFQEVFLTVWLKRKQYKFPMRFRSWLFAIATNRCRQHFRKASSQGFVQVDDLDAVDPTTSTHRSGDAAMDAETVQMVQQAVAALPPQQRSVVVLRTWNGLSYREIAEITGCAEATVRSYMHHALVSLRRCLQTTLRPDDA